MVETIEIVAFGAVGGAARSILGTLKAMQEAEKNEKKFSFSYLHFIGTIVEAALFGAAAGAIGITDPLTIGTTGAVGSELYGKLWAMLTDRYMIWKNRC